MRKALFISYYYPPGFRVGYERVVKFRKYLPQWGYRTCVLGTRVLGEDPSDESEHVHRSTEPALLYRRFLRLLVGRSATTPDAAPRGITEGTGLQRLRDWMLEWVFIPDLHVLWAPFAVWAGVRLLRREAIDVIVSSSGPETNHLVGVMLSLLMRKPLIADFRDGWLHEPLKDFLRRNRFRQRIDGALERLVVARSAAIVTVSEPISDYFRTTYPRADDRVVTITNGFDPDDWKGVKAAARTPGRFRIVSTGSFSRSRVTADPAPFFAALHSLSDEIRQRLEVVLVGSLTAREIALIGEYGLADIVRHIPQVSREESLSYQQSADLLLLVVGDDRSVATSKLFEYLYVRRPILAMGRPDAAACRIVAASAAGFVVHGSEPAIIAEQLGRIVTAPPSPPPNASIDQYDRSVLARHLAELMDGILTPHGNRQSRVATTKSAG